MTQAEEEIFFALAEYWTKVVKELKSSLIAVGRNASDNTASQFGVPPDKSEVNLVTVTSQGYAVKLWMPYYYDFINKGVSGTEITYATEYKYSDKMPPISAIRNFMFNRGISKPRKKERDKDTNKLKSKISRLKRKERTPKNTRSAQRQDMDSMLNGIAFAIAKSIQKEGLKPTKFYDNVVNSQKIAQFEQELLDKFDEYVLEVIKID